LKKGRRFAGSKRSRSSALIATGLIADPSSRVSFAAVASPSTSWRIENSEALLAITSCPAFESTKSRNTLAAFGRFASFGTKAMRVITTA
jgi:hypothetical protein